MGSSVTGYSHFELSRRTQELDMRNKQQEPINEVLESAEVSRLQSGESLANLVQEEVKMDSPLYPDVPLPQGKTESTTTRLT
mmetsp:Transcript_10693/g.13298  ORF Transcript_10693/g.13298 Transcript_10693/m.13298 type:complete len:82 (-) Transcript_10693:3770-4015(-)